MSKLEKKFGKYAIPNLTLWLLGCYAVGYLINMINPSLLLFFTLDPYQILHGQVWRLVTWLLIPPESFGLFTIVMLLFYYNIGTTLERTWGTWRYNVFMFGGMFFMIVASFLCLGVNYLLGGGNGLEIMSYVSSMQFSTYYISTSIFLGFAMTYPDVQVLLMFIIPIKVKWMGIFYVATMLVTFFSGSYAVKFAVGAALLNVLIFYLSSRNMMHLSPKQIKRRAQFNKQVKQNQRITRHKCAICGRTEEDDPGLEFRFCSKCNGNYEYCQYHLFTHEHVK